MTEAQIKTACFEYCRLIGVDPNESLYLGDYEEGQMRLTPRWMTFKVKVLEQYFLNKAIQHAEREFRGE